MLGRPDSTLRPPSRGVKKCRAKVVRRLAAASTCALRSNVMPTARLLFITHYGRSVLTRSYSGRILGGMKSTRQTDPALAVAYIRVSTEDQNLGPDAQRASIAAWAARQGVQVAAWFTDQGVSGGKPVEDRPPLVAALEAARTPRARLLCAGKRDRCAPRALV